MKKQHQWEWMANHPTKGELGRCPLCNQWRWNNTKPLFKMTWEQFEVIDKESRQ